MGLCWGIYQGFRRTSIYAQILSNRPNDCATHSNCRANYRMCNLTGLVVDSGPRVQVIAVSPVPDKVRGSWTNWVESGHLHLRADINNGNRLSSD